MDIQRLRTVPEDDENNEQQTKFVLFPPVKAPNIILLQQLSVLTTVLQSMDIEWDVAFFHYDHAVLQGTVLKQCRHNRYYHRYPFFNDTLQYL